MATYEVTTELLIACRVKVLVEADDNVAAIDAAADMLPQNGNPASSKGWDAKVDLTTPKGVRVSSCKPYHFQQASGGDKARKASVMREAAKDRQP